MKNKARNLILLTAATIVLANPVTVKAENMMPAAGTDVQEMAVGNGNGEENSYMASGDGAQAVQEEDTYPNANAGATSDTNSNTDTSADTNSAANVQVFSYDDTKKMITGKLKTSGIDGVTRLEFYFSDSYETADDKVCMSDNAGRCAHLNGENAYIDGDNSDDVQVYYGGQASVQNYRLRCVTYYITSTEDLEWTVNIAKDDALRECFIAKSQVPLNWNTVTDGLITKPLTLEGYYVNQNASAFINLNQVVDALNENAVDQKEITYKGEKKEEEKKDPIKIVLIIAIVIVLISIAVTIIMLKKDNEKKEEQRRDASVKKQNDKLKKQKANENKTLEELINSYDEEYIDDDNLNSTCMVTEKNNAEALDSPDSEKLENKSEVQMQTAEDVPVQTSDEGYTAQQQPHEMPTQMQNMGVSQQPQMQTAHGMPNQQIPHINPVAYQNMNQGNTYPNYPNYPNYQNQQTQEAPAFANANGMPQHPNGLKEHTSMAYPTMQGYQGQIQQSGTYNVQNAYRENNMQNSAGVNQPQRKKVPAFARKG